MIKLLLYSFLSLFIFLAFSCKKQEIFKNTKTIMDYSIVAGDTLGESLDETGLAIESRTEILKGLSTVFNPRQCIPGDHYEIEYDLSAHWTNFRYYSGKGLAYYSVERSTEGNIVAAKKSRSTKKILKNARGTINSSLWESMSSQNISADIIMDFADIFAWQIDFLTEPRVGDSYWLAWEETVADNGYKALSKITIAQYTASKEPYTGILFSDKSKREDYYSPEGKSLRSTFLKAPLQFRRISSFFTTKRFHPVLKYYRPHLGIDYAAPSGTPVSAIGDGNVIFAARQGGFGKLVQIRHTNGYISYYGHLSNFGKNIRSGNRVRQGQVIGYVGSTGLSTGPHLDFRIKRGNTYLNFLKIRMPAASVIPQNEMEDFRKAKKEAYTRLAEIH